MSKIWLIVGVLLVVAFLAGFWLRGGEDVQLSVDTEECSTKCDPDTNIFLKCSGVSSCGDSSCLAYIVDSDGMPQNILPINSDGTPASGFENVLCEAGGVKVIDCKCAEGVTLGTQEQGDIFDEVQQKNNEKAAEAAWDLWIERLKRIGERLLPDSRDLNTPPSS